MRRVERDGRRQLVLDDAGVVDLVPVGEWSWWIPSPPAQSDWLDEAAAWAAHEGVLDLRAEVPLPDFVDVAPGQWAHAVRQPLPDVAATRALGARLAAALRPGDLLVLAGPLGAGKTTLTQGIGARLGVRGRVTSPTFVLARAHRGPVPLLHVDAYRLRDSGAFDLDDLDLDAALEDAVTVVEWGDGVVERLSENRLDIVLERAVDSDERSLTVLARGPRWRVDPGTPRDTDTSAV